MGWRKGGGAATDLAPALDTLRLATFRARVYNACLGETRIDPFGLIDRWERGECHQSGRSARPGFVVLGDWLHDELSVATDAGRHIRKRAGLLDPSRRA